MYKRAEYQIIKNRLEEQRKFIQVVMGARQIGKSTVVKQVLKDISIPYRRICINKANVPADLQSAGIEYKDFQSACFLFLIA